MIDPDNSPYVVVAGERKYRLQHPSTQELLERLRARERQEQSYRKTKQFFERFGVDI
jgi:hypothetical protein